MRQEELFFQLIQVAIGNRVCLTRTLRSTSSGRAKTDEWGELYAMAKKQSLVGVCFAGVQKLQAQRQAPNSWGNEQGELLYLQWMGMAAKIQQRNETVAKRCVELQGMFEADGFRTCVLKGQDYARYYFNDNVDDNHNLDVNANLNVNPNLKDDMAGDSACKLGLRSGLGLLRQSGDIDLWVKGNMDEVIAWARKKGVEIGHIDIKHSDMGFFKDTDVEVHFRPSWMYCPKTDERLQKWFEEFGRFDEAYGMKVPPLEFSLVYCMVHIYRHFFSEGIGLRQVLDYYFLLIHSSAVQRQDAMSVFERLHMKGAVAGIMYLLTECFGMDEGYRLCAPDAEIGRFLLKEMMTSGNFGHDDSRFKHVEKSKRWQRGWIGLKRNMKFLQYFPEEVLWSPVWKVWHYCWRKRKGYL